MRKSICFLAGGAALAAAGMHGFNQYIDSTAAKKNLLQVQKGNFYIWNNIRIFYTRLGAGKPLFLLHDINVASCSKEWTGIRKILAKNHTVYTIDFPGCGRSDKPAIYYTNYMYARMVCDFIHNIIGESTDVVSSNTSSHILLAANQLKPDSFGRIILINPAAIPSAPVTTNAFSPYAAALLSSPLFGTFFYNLKTTRFRIEQNLCSQCYLDSSKVPSGLKDCFYEAAHLGHGTGKYLNASLLTHYTDMDLRYLAASLSKPITVLNTHFMYDQRHYEKFFELNENFLPVTMPEGKLYPHLEYAEKVAYTISQITG